MRRGKIRLYAFTVVIPMVLGVILAPIHLATGVFIIYVALIVGSAEWLWDATLYSDRRAIFLPIIVTVACALIFAGVIAWLFSKQFLHSANARAPNIKGYVIGADIAEPKKVDGINWMPGYAQTQLVIQNNSTENITDLNIVLQPEFHIIGSSARYDFGKCTIKSTLQMAAPTEIIKEPNGKTYVLPQEQNEDDFSISPSHRLFCDKMIRKSQIEVTLATVEYTGDINHPYGDKRRDPSFVNYMMQYTASGVVETSSGHLNLGVIGVPGSK